MSVLLTGFEPFDGADTNPSWEAVCRVADSVAGHDVVKVMLPTVFGQAGDVLRGEIRRVRPDVVICCGVAGGRKAVTPELVAINYRHARIPDNAGNLFRAQPVRPDGPAAYFTRLPIHDMVDALNQDGIPAALSLSAGAYVCNDVYYTLLDCEAEFGHRGIFLHVPGVEAVPTEQAAQAIRRCVEIALAADVPPQE